MDEVPVARELLLVPLVHLHPGNVRVDSLVDVPDDVPEDVPGSEPGEPMGIGEELWQQRWGESWQREVEEAGATGLPLSPHGFSCVEARALVSDGAIALVLRAHQPDLWACLEAGDSRKLRSVIEQLGALSGGFVLFIDGEPFIAPGCCAGLDDIADWAALAGLSGAGGAGRAGGAGELAVWAGHDRWQLHGRYERERLVLRRTGDGYNRDAEAVQVEVSPSMLQEAVQAATGELTRLGERLAAWLTPKVGARAGEIAGRLVGLDEAVGRA